MTTEIQKPDADDAPDAKILRYCRFLPSVPLCLLTASMYVVDSKHRYLWDSVAQAVIYMGPACALIGLTLRFSPDTRKIKTYGINLFYGALLTIIPFAIFLLLLSLTYPLPSYPR